MWNWRGAADMTISFLRGLHGFQPNVVENPHLPIHTRAQPDIPPDGDRRVE